MESPPDCTKPRHRFLAAWLPGIMDRRPSYQGKASPGERIRSPLALLYRVTATDCPYKSGWLRPASKQYFGPDGASPFSWLFLSARVIVPCTMTWDPYLVVECGYAETTY
jgi:hypothetical protein